MREENEKLITVGNLQKALEDYDEIKGTAVVECEELPEKTENRTYKVHGEKDSVFVKDTEIATEEALLEEKARATEAENALTESLNAEKTRATEAEAKLNESISEEKARAKEAETTLSEAVTKETDRATEAENELKEAIVNKNDAIQEEFSDSKIDDYSSIYIAELDRAESSLEKITSLLKKPVVNFWNYIRNKIDSDLGIRLKSDTLEVDGSTTLVRVPGSITEKWTTQDFQGGNGTQFGGGSATTRGFTHGLYIDASADGAKWYERRGNSWSVQVNAGTKVYIPASESQSSRDISVTLYAGTEIEKDGSIQSVNGKTYVSFTVTKSGYLSAITYTHENDRQIKADSDGVSVLRNLSVGEEISVSDGITFDKGKRRIGFGQVPRDFVAMNDVAYQSLNLDGIYMVSKLDETAGIIISPNGIDMWAPPDNDLVRFWDEDTSKIVAKIDNYGSFHSAEYRHGTKTFTSVGYRRNEMHIDFDEDLDNSDYILTFEFTRHAEFVDSQVLIGSKDTSGFDIIIYTKQEDEEITFNWYTIPICAI